MLPKEFTGGVFQQFQISKRTQTTLVLIHELIQGYYPSIRSGHHTGNNIADHPAMAEAAALALVSTGLVNEEIPITGNASSYFNNALKLACGMGGL